MQEEKQYEEEEDFDQDYVPFTDIEKLSSHYQGGQDLNKLKEAGFCTIESLVMSTRKEIEKVKGINEGKIQSIFNAIKQFNKDMNGGCMSFSTGRDVLEKHKHIRKISTGSKVLDAMLGGGIESQSITEAYGEFRSGKTQLAHTLAVSTQRSIQDGGGLGKVIYFDTEGTFRPDRIISIANRFNLDAMECLDNIKHAKVYSVEHFQDLLSIAQKMLVEDGPYSLVIVDSIMANFRVDFSGRGELSERQQVLGKTLSSLKKIADQFNVAVFLTNQVQSDPSGMSMGNTAKPIGGNVLAHASTTRLHLKKGSKEERSAVLVDSPSCKEDTVKYKITEGGIFDI